MVNKPSKQTIVLLKKIGKKFEIDFSEIKRLYTKIFESKVLVNLKESDEIREKHSTRVLLAELTNKKDRNEFSGKVVPVIIRIESKEGITSFKRSGSNEESYRAGLFVTVEDEEENISLGQLTLWGDACENHPILTVGETYSTKCVIGNRNDIWQMSMNKPEEVEDSVVELKPIKDLVTEIFMSISIEDVENNISKDRDDIKLVEGTVVSSWQKVVASGRDMGFVKIISDIDPDDAIVAKFSGDANQVNSVSIGDFVYVLGQTTPAVLNNDGTIQYDIGMWGSLIIPVIHLEQETEESDDVENESTGSEKTEDSEDGDISGAIGGW